MIPARGAALLLTAALLAALLFGGCSADSAPALDEQRRDELAQAFGEELRGQILPNRDVRIVMRELGVYISDDEFVDEYETVRAFANAVQANVDCALTIAFYSRSFVVTRVVFEGGSGYYYRYEYDRFDPAQVALDFKQMRTASFAEVPELYKGELTLEFFGGDSAVFTFRLEDYYVREERGE